MAIATARERSVWVMTVVPPEALFCASSMKTLQ
jgi:hypothetical protein